MNEWNTAYDLTGRILEEALRKNLQGAEIRHGDTRAHDAMILDDYKVVGGNVLLQVTVRDFPYFHAYYELAASLPHLPDPVYSFPHPDFEIDGLHIRPVIDIHSSGQRAILLLARY